MDLNAWLTSLVVVAFCPQSYTVHGPGTGKNDVESLRASRSVGRIDSGVWLSVDTSAMLRTDFTRELREVDMPVTVIPGIGRHLFVRLENWNGNDPRTAFPTKVSQVNRGGGDGGDGVAGHGAEQRCLH